MQAKLACVGCFILSIILCLYYYARMRAGWCNYRLAIDNRHYMPQAHPVAVADDGPSAAEPSLKNDTEHLTRKRQRLTDVLVPFFKGQVARVEETFRRWTQFPPCPAWEYDDGTMMEVGVAEHNDDFYHMNRDVGRNINLTLALSGTEDPEIRERLSHSFHALPRDVTRCFKNVRVCFAGLTGKADSYINSSRNMSELFLNNTFGLENPYYVFYMEPDVLPLRKYWLSALDATTRWPTAPFWLKGSIYHGNNRAVFIQKQYALHINGNAVYNLDDKEFARFYFDKVKPFIKDHPRRCGYDSDLYLYLLEGEKYEQNALIAHKFPYSDTLFNMWHESFSIRALLKKTPLLYLSHGGSPKE